MGDRRSMFLPRFVHGSSNEELIVEIFGNATLSSVKNSFISWSSTAVSQEVVFLCACFHNALNDETETKRKTVLSSTFLHRILVTSRSAHANQQPQNQPLFSDYARCHQTKPSSSV